ncbi:MAG TPA: hypothetical protein VFO65_02270, partial [Acidimicrobiales bacterium]|nr:hypothetical protein [Acidimicrobiales bacterium]
MALSLRLLRRPRLRGRDRAPALAEAPGRAGWSALAPPIDIDGPRVRLGVLWAGVTAAAVTTGPVLTSVVFAPVALGAAGQACRTWRGRERRPNVAVAAGGAVLCALAAMAGPLAVGAAAGLTLPAALAVRRRRVGGVAWDVPLTVAVALLVGAGAAAPAVIRGQLGATPALVFLALVHAVDASAFIVSSGTDSRWEGWVAGAAS